MSLPPLERVAVAGGALAFRRAGSGPALVLLHGALGDSREWHPQLEGLADVCTVVAWDCPGCGGSDDPPESWRLPELADHLAAFMAALGLRRPHVLGLSFGAALALQLAGRHPGRVRSLVLASGYAGWAGSLPPDEVAARLRTALGAAESDPASAGSHWLPGLFGPAAPPGVVDEVVAVMRDSHPVGTRTMARALAEADLRDLLPGIAVPTLVVHGGHDARAPRPVAEGLRAAIPGARLVALPDVGHMVNLEAPARFDAEVRAFLGSVPS